MVGQVKTIPPEGGTTFLLLAGAAEAGEGVAEAGAEEVAEGESEQGSMCHPRTAFEDPVIAIEPELGVFRIGVGFEPGYGPNVEDVHSQRFPVMSKQPDAVSFSGNAPTGVVPVNAWQQSFLSVTGDAATSHSASVGNRLPANRAKASASCQVTPVTGWSAD